MRRLAELQSGFDAALRGGPLPAGLTARDPAEAERRFNVYRNNVVVSLTEALAMRFPVVQRLVGEAFFRQMARVYVELDRPKTPVLTQWGDGFPAFLAGFPPLLDYPYMADVARIEYQRGVAFHAADHEPATPDLFANADPADLVLALHPSVCVLALAHAAVAIWASNQPGALPGAIVHGPETALIFRDRFFNVPVKAIAAGDAAMIAALSDGRPLLEAAQLAQAADPAHDAGRLLAEFMAAGLILNAEISTCRP